MGEKDFNEPGRNIHPFETLKHNIRPGVGLSELVNIVKSQAPREFLFGDIASFADWIVDEWHDQLPERLVDIDKQPSEHFKHVVQNPLVFEVPGTPLHIANHQVIFHGVIHAFDTGKKDPDNEFRQVFKQYFDSTLSIGDLWVAEEGLDEYYGLSNECISLHDIRTFVKSRGDNFGERNKQPANKLSQFAYKIRLAAHIGIETYGGAQCFEGMRRHRELTGLLQRYRRDYHDLILLRRFYSEFKLPEPLHMEVLLALDSKKDGLLENNRSGLVHRSLLQAHEIHRLLRSQEFKSNKRIHVVAGLAHETQDMYLLTHPSYDPLNAVQYAQKILADK